jgi:biopolymer transport protein ExbD
MSAQLDHGGDELAENHEINLTPFIDVMLVLLIIFMLAAPLATVDVPVNLPGSNAEPQAKPPEPLYLTLQADLTLSLGDAPVADEALAQALDRAATLGDRAAGAARAAPAAGRDRARSAKVTYEGLLLAHLERNKRYPATAHSRRQEGQPYLRSPPPATPRARRPARTQQRPRGARRRGAGPARTRGAAAGLHRGNGRRAPRNRGAHPVLAAAALSASCRIGRFAK